MRILNIVAAALFVAGSAFADQSTINPGVPAANSSLSSAPIRANFQAAYNDINRLFTAISPDTILSGLCTTSGAFPVYVSPSGWQCSTVASSTAVMAKNNITNALTLTHPDATAAGFDNTPIAALYIARPPTPTTRNLVSGFFVETDGATQDKGRGGVILNYGKSDSLYIENRGADSSGVAVLLKDTSTTATGIVIGTTLATHSGLVVRQEVLQTPTAASSSLLTLEANGALTEMMRINSTIAAQTGFIFRMSGSGASPIIVRNSSDTANVFQVNNAGTITSPLLIGGTGVGSSLELRATSGVGAGSEYVAISVGNNGALEGARLAQSSTNIPVLLLGATTPQFATSGANYHNIQSHTISATPPLGSYKWTADANGSQIQQFKSRGATVGTHTIVQNNDIVGSNTFGASDGTFFRNIARIQIFVDGTPGASDMPGRMSLETTLDGTATPVIRQLIFNDGGINIGAGGSTAATTTSPGAGILKLEGTTASTSKTTGTLVNAGGFGNAGAIFTDTLSVITMANTATTSAVCYNTSTGLLTYDGTIGTCTISLLSAKNLQKPLSPKEGFDIVMAMTPWRYTMKKGLPTYVAGEQIGFVADYAAKIDPRVVAFNHDGTLAGFRYEQYTAALTAAFQWMKADNDNLRHEVEELKRRAK